jgi:hypothetical protein
MAHFAEIDGNNIVQRVIVVPNAHEANGPQWCANLLGGTWLQTSYNATIRYNYAGIGFTYDPVRDAFIPPKPYPSWVLDESTCRWEAPTPMPPGGPWVWDESTESWIDPELHD